MLEGKDVVLIRTPDIHQVNRDKNLADYSEEALSIVADCTNTGIPEGANACAMTGKSKRGTIAMQLFGVVDPKTETFVRAGFRAHGCVAMIACASTAARLIEGKTLSQALAITPEMIAEVVGKIPSNKAFTFYIATESIRAAIGDYLIRAGKTSSEIKAFTSCNTAQIGCCMSEDCSLRAQLLDLDYSEIPQEIVYNHPEE